MQRNTLGNSNLKVSQLCLGTMTFGEQNTLQQAHQQLDFALDCGINFIDTAEMYPVYMKPETCHRTEDYIGQWLQKSDKRDDIILATKVTGPNRDIRHIRHTPRLNKQQINQAIDGSLKRLQADVIDLYQIHWPSRKTNYFGKLGFSVESSEDETPILETLEAMAQLIKEGKIRHFGLSNETSWGVSQYLNLAKKHQLPKPISIQNPYNLLNRTFEIGLAEYAHYENIPLLAYSPLAFGTLTGKYLQAMPKGSRLQVFPDFDRYTKNPATSSAIKKYVDLANKHHISPTHLALGFVNQRSFLGSNIIGATSIAQLKENIESINCQLVQEILDEIETIHLSASNPCP